MSALVERSPSLPSHRAAQAESWGIASLRSSHTDEDDELMITGESKDGVFKKLSEKPRPSNPHATIRRPNAGPSKRRSSGEAGHDEKGHAEKRIKLEKQAGTDDALETSRQRAEAAAAIAKNRESFQARMDRIKPLSAAERQTHRPLPATLTRGISPPKMLSETRQTSLSNGTTGQHLLQIPDKASELPDLSEVVDAKPHPSTLKTNGLDKPLPTWKTTTTCPFIIDDSGDEEEAPQPTPQPVITPPKTSYTTTIRKPIGLSEEQKEAARQESRRLREETAKKKQQQNVRGMRKSDDSDVKPVPARREILDAGKEKSLLGQITKPTETVSQVKLRTESKKVRDSKGEVSRTSSRSSSTASRNSPPSIFKTLLQQTSSEPIKHANTAYNNHQKTPGQVQNPATTTHHNQPSPRTEAHSPNRQKHAVTKVDSVNAKPDKTSSDSNHISSYDAVQKAAPSLSAKDPAHELPAAGLSTTGRHAEDRLRVKGEEGSRNRNGELQAEIRANSIKERLYERTSKPAIPITESTKKGAEEIATWRDMDAARKAQTPAKQSPASISEAEEAVAKAAKEADARKMLDYQKKAEGRRLEQQRKFEVEKKAREVQREREVKRQEEQAAQQLELQKRSSALENLLQARKVADSEKPGGGRQSGTGQSDAVRSGTGIATFVPAQPPAVGQQSVQSPASMPRTGNDTDNVRAQRIEAMLKRNALNREREEEPIEEPQPDIVDVLPSKEEISKGPVSLNSLAGQQALAGLNSPLNRGFSRETVRADVESPEQSRKKAGSHDRKLGEILPQDIKLMRWRDEGLQYPDIVRLFENSLGQKRGRDTLRKRYVQVKEALAKLDISDDLLNRASEGGAEARKELNAAVHGMWPLPAERARDAKGHFLGSKQRSDAPSSSSSFDTSNSCSFDSTFTELTVPSRGTPELAALTERSQVGGKTLTPKTMMYWTQGLAETLLEDYEESDREPSPVSPEDYYQWVFYVQRRQVYQEQLEDGDNIDDMPWIACSRDFTDLTAANGKAIEQVTRVPPGFPPITISEDQDQDLQVRSNGDGMKHVTFSIPGSGIVQTRVSRYERLYGKGSLPTNRDHCISRTIYFVKERTRALSGDGLFESKQTDTVTDLLDNQVHFCLRMANEVAIKRFVELTFTPPSTRESAKAAEIQAAEKELLDLLDEDEGEMFRQSADNADGSVSMKVWVESGHASGPTNVL